MEHARRSACPPLPRTTGRGTVRACQTWLRSLPPEEAEVAPRGGDGVRDTVCDCPAVNREKDVVATDSAIAKRHGTSTRAAGSLLLPFTEKNARQGNEGRRERREDRVRAHSRPRAAASFTLKSKNAAVRAAAFVCRVWPVLSPAAEAPCRLPALGPSCGGHRTSARPSHGSAACRRPCRGRASGRR